MSDLRILGIANNVSIARRHASGTRGFLVHHLAGDGCVSDIVDCTLSKWKGRYHLARNVALDKSVWSLKKGLDTSLRKDMAEKALRLMDGKSDYNMILQIGSILSKEMLPAHAADVPMCSYHDDNVFRYFQSRTRSMSARQVQGLQQKYQAAFEYERNVYQSMDAILCMTDYLRSVFIEEFGIPEHKVHSIGYGPNMDVSGLEWINRDYDARNLLFIAQNSFYEKGGGLLLDALRIVRRSVSDVTLTIVGENKGIDQEGVYWTGYLDKRIPEQREQFEQILRSTSLYAMPSFVEAAGVSFLEAMAHGIPCVGANQGATPEIIVGTGSGRVLNSMDPVQLSEILIEMLESPVELERMGRNAYQAVQEKYNWTSVIEKAKNKFHELLLERY